MGHRRLLDVDSAPKREVLDDETAVSILRQCKVSKEDIEAFLRHCKC